MNRSVQVTLFSGIPCSLRTPNRGLGLQVGLLSDCLPQDLLSNKPKQEQSRMLDQPKMK